MVCCTFFQPLYIEEVSFCFMKAFTLHVICLPGKQEIQRFMASNSFASLSCEKRGDLLFKVLDMVEGNMFCLSLPMIS